MHLQLQLSSDYIYFEDSPLEIEKIEIPCLLTDAWIREQYNNPINHHVRTVLAQWPRNHAEQKFDFFSPPPLGGK